MCAGTLPVLIAVRVTRHALVYGRAMGTGHPGFDYDMGKFRFSLPRLQATVEL